MSKPTYRDGNFNICYSREDAEAVEIEDYEALERELAEAKRSLAEANDRIKHLSDGHTQTSLHLIHAGINSFGWNHEGVDKLAAKLRASEEYAGQLERIARRFVESFRAVTWNTFEEGAKAMHPICVTAFNSFNAALKETRPEIDRQSEPPDPEDYEQLVCGMSAAEEGVCIVCGHQSVHGECAQGPVAPIARNGVCDCPTGVCRGEHGVNQFCRERNIDRALLRWPAREQSSMVRVSSSRSPLRAAIEGEELVVRIGTGTLCYALSHNAIEPEFKVVDEVAFIQWFARKLIDFDEDETGTSALGRVFDRLAVDAIESGETFVTESSQDPQSEKP